MKVLPFDHTKRIIIDPGEHYVSRKPEIISTRLGSCVSACLYDPINRVFGMNHFLLAFGHKSNHSSITQSTDAHYGLYAMEMLINDMMKLGANRLNLKAKCFGGAHILKLREDRENDLTVADINIIFIKEFLKARDIPLISAALGGKLGRSVHFSGTDFSVFVKKVAEHQVQPLENQERRFWKHTLETQERKAKRHAGNLS